MDSSPSKSREDHKRHSRRRKTNNPRSSDDASSRRSGRTSAGGTSTTFINSRGQVVDRYVPAPPASPTTVSTDRRASVSVPEPSRSIDASYAQPTPTSAHHGGHHLATVGHNADDDDGELSKKWLSHKDVRPGMLVWTENRELEILSKYYGKSLLSKSKEYAGAKHLELVVSKSADNTHRPYVRALMLTTFGGATSLRKRGVDEKRWKFCVPRWPAICENEEQYGPVTFTRGLRNEGIVPGWILIHARGLVLADKDDHYVCFETEMDGNVLRDLNELAKNHESEFAMEARIIRDNPDPTKRAKLADSYSKGGGKKRGDH